MKTEQLQQHLINKTIEYCFDYSSHNGVKFNPNKAKEYMKETMCKRFNDITKEVQKDAKDADILQTGKFNFMVKQATNISLIHGLVMYAKDIVEHSKLL